MLEKIRKHANFFFCFLIWLFSAVNEVYWLKLDNFPLIWDASGHYIISILFFRTLKEGIFAAPNIFNIDHYYPPLAPLVATPFYALFNISTDIGVAGMNISFMAVLIFSTFYIGKKIMNQTSGVISAFIVSMFPFIFTYSRYFMLDFPLVSMVALSLCMMLFTDKFDNRKYSIFFGITLGLGMLTKWTFIIFIIGPLIYFLYISSRISERCEFRFQKIFKIGIKDGNKSEEPGKTNIKALMVCV